MLQSKSHELRDSSDVLLGCDERVFLAHHVVQHEASALTSGSWGCDLFVLGWLIFDLDVHFTEGVSAV